MSDSSKRGKPAFHPDEDYGNAGTDLPGEGSDNQSVRTGKFILFGFLIFFSGWLVIALTNPFGWSDDTMLFCAFGSFCLLLWCVAFFPVIFGKRKKFRSDLKGCVSLFLLGFGALSLFMFFVTKPEAHHEHFSIYFKHIEGHAITDGLGSVPKSQSTGRAVQISFRKSVDFSVRLYRVDDSGNLKFRKELRSLNSANMDTFAGETWVVTDIGDKPLYYFVAQQTSAENEVNLARIPPASKAP